MEPILIELPKGMTTADVAEYLTAYLLGAGAFENSKLPTGERRDGPFNLGHKWQLDGSNDFWLHEYEPGTCRLTCRYDGQDEVARAMVALFQVRFSLLGRPWLTQEERAEIVARWPDSFTAGDVPTETEVARTWADHYWYNKSIDFKDGNPMDALTVAPAAKLLKIAKFYEHAGYRSRLEKVD